MKSLFKISRCFSTIRVYASIFTLTNSTYTLDADLGPPELQQPENSEVRIKYHPSLRFTVIETSKKYTRGSRKEGYFLKYQHALELACWKPQNGNFEQVHNNKAVILAKKS